jgi:lipopolysaccharide assembly outer membrane protein LptD (OstA)
MDENLAWKTVYIAAIFSLLVIGAAYCFIAPRQSPFFTDEKTEKIAEFKNTRVAGRKEGKKIWEFLAESGWTEANREVTHLSNVSKGKIYQNEKLVVKDLCAPRVKAFSGSEIVEAEGAPLRARLDLGKMSDPKKNAQPEWTAMIADRLTHYPQKKESQIEGKIRLSGKNGLIYADRINIDHDKKTAFIYGNVRVKRGSGFLATENLRYLSGEEKLEADSPVRFKIKEGVLITNAKANHAFFFSDTGKDMTLTGSLEVLQGKKTAVAEAGVYAQKKKALLLTGNVRVVFEKARAILKESSVNRLKSREARDILKEKTVLNADRMLFSTRTGDADASGNVTVSQKGKEARAEHALYNEEKELLILTDNVRMKKENEEWINAKKVVVAIKEETFDAEGSVEAQFKL